MSEKPRGVTGCARDDKHTHVGRDKLKRTGDTEFGISAVALEDNAARGNQSLTYQNLSKIVNQVKNKCKMRLL